MSFTPHLRGAALVTYNRGIREWSTDALAVLLTRTTLMGIVDTGMMFRTMRTSLGYDIGGEVERISFKMKRYMILQDKGAGRGYDASGGQLRRVSPNPSRTGKERTIRPWFSGYMNENGLRSLADRVASLQADGHAKQTADEIFDTLKLRN